MKIIYHTIGWCVISSARSIMLLNVFYPEYKHSHIPSTFQTLCIIVWGMNSVDGHNAWGGFEKPILNHNSNQLFYDL